MELVATGSFIRNRKLGTALAAGAVAIGFLLGASSAQAADVTFDPENDRKAIGITNLEIDGVFYNVTFPEEMTAQQIYGGPPGTYDFNSIANATTAVEAINVALNAEPILPLWVGVEEGVTDESTQEYLVGYSRSKHLGVGVLNAVVGQNLFLDEWRDNEPVELPAYEIDPRTFAIFRGGAQGPSAGGGQETRG